MQNYLYYQVIETSLSEKFIAEASNRIQYDELNGELLLQDDAQISISGERTIKANKLKFYFQITVN